MGKLKTLLASALVSLAFGGTAIAQEEEAAAPPLNEFPREETLIINNPEPPAINPDMFNMWVAGNGAAWSNGLHQLVLDTLWFIDPDAGLDGALYNQLAKDVWQYNEDFTEMTVQLREGILWSDGEEFTADDVVFTVETQMETPGMVWSAPFSQYVESVEAVDDYTVHFKLKEPNSRFHSIFSVRWNGAWIMPEHIFSEVEDVTAFDFNPPVGLGPYTLHSYDPNGYWYIWEKREDWDKTALAEWGEPGPKYVIYRSIPSTDSRLIDMVNGDLDMIHDLTPEGMFSLIKQSEISRGWFPGFPYAHPDPTLPMVIFNHQNEKFQDKRVRWALALMLDARAISMASYRGAATLSAIAIPPTGTHPRDYHAPLQDWLIDYELDTGSRTIKPYDPTIGLQVADMVRPQFGEEVPTDEEAIRTAFGYGWWKQDVEAATELLEAAGFTKQGNQWMMPNGEPFAFTLNTFQEGVINRMGTMIAQQWSQQGIQVTAEADPEIYRSTLPLGQYEAATAWSIETWGGDPDLSFFLDSWHSDYVAEPGERQPHRNWQRWKNPKLDEIIEEVRKTEFTDPRNLELGHEFVKLMVEEMPVIPVMSFNVFSAYDTRYWTGFPTAEENPYANIVTNWANSKYILTQLKPTKQQ
ncbi:ABC transporter substrate-binding protein [Chelativorans salis]|uniref:ABC transporter substrate-binding protein n=1 Tax=Chelativorans salis TaxID=2978478 RepID=A0ABT2LXZ0_9HYPH|nr:ABC transporter substrate-binding protein [Chelativorans sp. EGI FJ00035]MCT7378463.1 ABC transporter substrate-binding protein [Chelativorans sp. EGI FJ00035]